MGYMKITLKRNIYILVFSVLSVISMQSCVDSIPIPVPNVNTMLVFESDINPSNGFNARITTSASLADVTAITYPTDLDVVVSTITEDVFELFYEEECQCYRNETVKPKNGLRYDVVATSPNNEIYKDIKSSMVFPYTTKSLELNAIRHLEPEGTTTLDATITLDGNSNSSNYYHILPYRKITEIKIVDQEEEEIYTGEIEYLDLVGSDNNNIHIESLYSMPGFLVEFYEEDISLNTLNLRLYTSTVINYETEAFTKVFYEVRSGTEHFYENEKYLSRKLASIQNGGAVYEPIKPKGNIINGLGYFGGYNTTIDSISVQ